MGCSSTTVVTRNSGEMMLNTRVTLLNGDYISLSSYLGKPLVTLFWARWCPHCRTFIPKLNQYASEVESGKVNFIAISVDDNADFKKVEEYIKTSKLDSLEHAFSGNGVYDEAFIAYGIEEFPKVIIHDSEGKIIQVTNDMSEIRATVRELY